jgi:acetyltransferase-like isoleucine patch superfamily enzyme
MDSFEQSLYELLDMKRNQMKEQYNRVLPTNELLYDRFKKAEFLKCGKNSSIYDSAIIMGEVEIGDNVWIGPYTLLEGYNASLKIGNFVSINSGVMIFTHDSTKYYLSGGKVPFEKGSVTIGNNTVIGSMSMITLGVNIGNHCVIGANSLVNKHIPDNSIAVGNPANVIGKVVVTDSSISYEYFKD